MEHDHLLSTFYAQILRRVRAKYEAKHPENVQLAEAIEQKWRRQLSCYTGIRMELQREPTEPASASDALTVVQSAAAAAAPQEEEEEIIVISARQRPDPEPSHFEVGAPARSMLPSMPAGSESRSIFGRLYGLNRKRKFPQLDGESAEDAEEESKGEGDEPTSPALAVSSALAPSYDITRFPCLLSAQYTKFKYRASRGVWSGKLRHIIMTLARPLTADESVACGDLLWQFADAEALDADGIGCVAMTPLGAMVEVVDVADALLSVKLPSGEIQKIPPDRLRRLDERLVHHALVLLQLV